MSLSEPMSAEQLFSRGNQCLGEGDLAGAEHCFRAALVLAPDLAELHANLAFVQDAQGDCAGAEHSYRRAIACNPGIAQVHLNLGTLLAEQKRLVEAEAAFVRAIELAPGASSGWSNLGGLYAGMQRNAEAELCCRQALLRNAEDAKAQFNLAYVLLRQGQLEEGWQCLEARDWYAALQSRLGCPRWRGESLAGRAILIGFEAGHGDMIQFSRYAALLKAGGAARVGLLCHPALATLFASLECVDEVMAFDQPFSDAPWDCWTPPLSLPFYFRTRVDTIPATLPYVQAQPGRVQHWEARLPAQGLKVGLVWKGSTHFENDADRSLTSLAQLASLAQIPGLHFVSLQKGAGEDQAQQPPAGFALLNCGPQLADFADTAALIANLDLVITVDTAVAHLTGALGRPCWVLLPHYKTDWRWLEGRSDSPWYPGVMRLFRQSAPETWPEVVQAVHLALQEWARSGASTG